MSSMSQNQHDDGMSGMSVEVDEHGRCDCAEGDYGAYGNRLSPGDRVRIDGETWFVVRVYSRIQTRQYASNFVTVDLRRA